MVLTGDQKGGVTEASAYLLVYSEMKDSGVEWLGRVPAHWQVKKLRQCAAILGGMTPSMNVRRYWGGEIPWVTPKDMKSDVITSSKVRVTGEAVAETSLRLIDAMAVLMVVRGMILALKVPVARTTAPVTINQDMKALVAGPEISADYLAAYLACAHNGLFPLIDEAGHGTRRLPTHRWRELGTAVPPLPEQTAIVRFLDHVDGRIRRAIRKKEKLLALLDEHRLAVIEQAVTGRIDVQTGKPFTAYKDSGVEWLPRVPARWTMRRNKWLFAERKETGHGDLPVLEVSLHSGVGIRDLDDGGRKQQIADRDKYKRAERGDLAYNMMRLWQGAIGVVPVDGLVSPAYVVARPLSEVEAPYYAYLFRTEAYKREVDRNSRGIVSDRNRLYWDAFKRLASPCPPPEEQRRIVEYLDAASDRIHAGAEGARRQIALLREYRVRLIADAVTGKVDVREAAANLPKGDPLDTVRDGSTAGGSA